MIKQVIDKLNVLFRKAFKLKKLLAQQLAFYTAGSKRYMKT